MNANTDTADATFNDIDQYALHGRIVELDNSDDVLIPFSPVWNELAAREVQLDQLVRSGNVESALFRGCREVPRIMRLAESTASTTQMLLAMAAKCARQDLLAGSAAGHAEASWNLGLMHERGIFVDASTLSAAEWFGLAAYQFFVTGDMRQAGEALKELARLAPTHPYLTMLRSKVERAEDDGGVSAAGTA